MLCFCSTGMPNPPINQAEESKEKSTALATSSCNRLGHSEAYNCPRNGEFKCFFSYLLIALVANAKKRIFSNNEQQRNL